MACRFESGPGHHSKSSSYAILAAIRKRVGCEGGVDRIHEILPIRAPALPIQVQPVPDNPSKADHIFDSEGRHTCYGSLLTAPNWTRVFSDNEMSALRPKAAVDL